MNKEKRTTERKTIITERFIGSKTNRATWIERAEIDVHQDGELIFHESMSGEWYRHKGINPVIKALIHLSATKEGKDSSNVRNDRSKRISFFRKIIRKLFHLKR